MTTQPPADFPSADFLAGYAAGQDQRDRRTAEGALDEGVRPQRAHLIDEGVAAAAAALEAAQHDPDGAWLHIIDGRHDIDYRAAATIAIEAAALAEPPMRDVEAYVESLRVDGATFGGEPNAFLAGFREGQRVAFEFPPVGEGA